MLTDEELTETERRLLRLIDEPGELGLNMRSFDHEADHPRNAGSWPANREVRAELLAELLTGERPVRAAHPRPFVLVGIRLTGRLDLNQATLVRPLALVACKVDETIELADARTPTISLYGCDLAGLAAQRVQVNGNLNLRFARNTGQQIDLLGAHIERQLLFSGAELTNPGGVALAAYDITVGQGMYCEEDSDDTLGGTHQFVAEGVVNISGANIARGIHFTGARLRNAGKYALMVENAVVDGNVDGERMEVTGGIDLFNTRVTGNASFDGSRLSCPGGHAFYAGGLEVGRELRIRNGFAAEGEVGLADAKVGTNLYLNDAELVNTGKVALNAERLGVEQDLVGARLVVDGGVLLGGTRVGGIVDLSGARLTNPEGSALHARSLTVGQYMVCDQGFQVDGEVNLSEARVGGSLELSGARLSNAGGVSLFAGLLDVAGDLRCDNEFRAEGQVYLAAARIGGALWFDGAKLVHEGRIALHADTLQVGRCLFGREGFEVNGEVNLVGAKLEELNLRGAALRNPGEHALRARALEVNQDVQFHNLSVAGVVALPGARIGGRLALDGAELTGTPEEKVDLSGVTATALSLRLTAPPAGVVDLTNAKVTSYDDDPASWPERLALRGFTYDVLTNDTVSVRDRLDWVARHEGGFVPGPYDQLAASFRRTGHVEDARRVAYAKLRRRRRVVAWPGKVWNVLLQVTVGYGYHPWRAALWLLGLLAAGSAVFAASYPADLVAARKPVPDFQPVAYTLDIMLPLDLGQQSAWLAQGAALACSWVLVITGWILAAMVLAGVTNALKRD